MRQRPRGCRQCLRLLLPFRPCWSLLVRLLGREVDVDLNAGIFVTLNPAGKKYGGRSKLPDNLKALFRPVAMGRPDNELIAEVGG